MNKYQHALNVVNFHCIAKQTKEIGLLQELVDKNTPMKPKNREVENLVEGGYIPLFSGECIKCDCEIHEPHKYCWNCGQAIKW